MKLKENSLTEKEFIDFSGKNVAIIFTDGDTLTGFVDGFIWASDNEPKIASLLITKDKGIIEVYQNEVSVIKEIK